MTMDEVDECDVLGQTTERLDGVVIGILLGFDSDQRPLVVFPGNRQDTAIAARTATTLGPDDLGSDVALMFENGDPGRPLVIGSIQQPVGMFEPAPESNATDAAPSGEVAIIRDGQEYLSLRAEREIELRCGKASITLTRAGKILIRGSYVLSRSSGVNKIKGGSVHLN